VVALRSGDTVPADGVIDEGEVYVDESPLTGEPTPVLKGKGDPLIRGLDSSIGVRQALRDQVRGEDLPGPSGRSRKEGGGGKITGSGPRGQGLGLLRPDGRRHLRDRLPDLALRPGLPPRLRPDPLNSGPGLSMPLGFGLATPTAIAVGIRRLLKRGIIVRDGEALQRLTEVRTFVIDKTGTLTEGKIKVVKFEGEVKLASCLERLSSHPIAKAISELSEGQCEVGDFAEFPGRGVHGVVDGRAVLVGSRDFVLANCNGEDRGADLLVCVDGRVEG